MKSLVVVANRLPVQVDARGEVGVSPGGVVSALCSATPEGTKWIGWGGPNSNDADSFEIGQFRLHPVPLSTADVSGHYAGFSNSVLWPLFHGRLRPITLNRPWWHAYERVNGRFADTVISNAALGATVWIHDYHLLLVPALLRKARPDLRLGLFLHIPFPSDRLFATLPWRRELLLGMLAADLVGFQTAEDVEHFVGVARRIAGAELHGRVVQHGSHGVEVGAFPISIDFAAWDGLGEQATAQSVLNRRAVAVRTILLGVDRLDYTKGISQRLMAFAELLDEGLLDAAAASFVQIGVPSRGDVSAYQDERREVEGLIRSINTRHRRVDGTEPVVYIDSSLPQAAIAAWYRTADALVVTSLADGMNIVAKEFVAARGDLGGTLILSEFAGASRDLEGAVVVNPYDIEAIKTAILTAVTMPIESRQARMRAMRASVRNNDVHRWSHRFLSRLNSIGHSHPSPRWSNGLGHQIAGDRL